MRTAVIRVFYWCAYSFYAGYVCFYSAFWVYGLGVANSDGKTEDLWTISFSMLITLIASHHVILFWQIRNYTIWLVGWCIVSVVNTPIAMVCVEYIFGTVLYRRQFTDNLQD